MKNILY